MTISKLIYFLKIDWDLAKLLPIEGGAILMAKVVMSPNDSVTAFGFRETLIILYTEQENHMEIAWINIKLIVDILACSHPFFCRSLYYPDWLSSIYNITNFKK